jgi:hypothetical protein
MTDPMDTPLIVRPALDEENIAPPGLSNVNLVARLKHLVKIERKAAYLMLAHLVEFDHRKLYADLGYPSLFAYCTRELGYSEDAACKRIIAARAAANFPALIRLLCDDRIHLAAVVVLAPHLTTENHQALLAQACGRSKREVESMVAALNSIEIERRDSIRHCGPGLVLFKFFANEGLRDKVERARQLMRHKFPSGSLELIFAEAVSPLLQKVDPELRLGNPRNTRKARKVVSGSRSIPQAIKNAVWERDGGRCSFVAGDGRRCGDQSWLEFDHITPWALGGGSEEPANIRLLCRTHNQLMARRIFGEEAVKPRAKDLSAPGRIDQGEPGLDLSG